MKPPSRTQAIVQAKCPRCRRGAMFTHPAYSSKFIRMHDDCPYCGLHYEVETGFFWGAMYVNYAFTVAIFIGSFVAMKVLAPTAPVVYTIALMLGLIGGLFPLLNRYARVLMLHWFGGVRFEADEWAKN